MLLASLPSQMIRWGQRVQSIEQLGDGACQVITNQGSFGPFDLVVGADGAWSRVRPLVSKERPIYSGVTFVELSHDDVDTRHPELAALVGRGKMFALGDGKGIISQRNSGAHFRTYLAFREPEGWAEKTIDFSDATRARADLEKQFQGFAPGLLDIIRRAGDHIVPRGIYALPVGHRWAHRPGVTLLGDAAHVMSPFSGEGVNIAMLDAAELAGKLATRGLENGIPEYEEAMFERAALAAAGAARGIEVAISPSAPQSVLAWFSHQEA
jgi:2-polyprenyl-6-methoxyphenol hydroxylase-like FAD-dependent oxidoreductase